MSTRPSAHPDVSLSGHRPLDVLAALERRARSGSRADGNRIAIVVEGGAMCGAYTAGSLLALHAIGLAGLVDSVYGTSAGAVNAAHFVSGRGEFKVDTYYRCLVDGRFLDTRRLWRMVDVDFFVDEVLTRERAVETERVLASDTHLWIGVGDYAAAEARVYSARDSGHALLSLLKASVALPVAYNRRVPLGAVQGFDAGFFHPFPLREALDAGHTHVLVLHARDEAHRAPPPRAWERALFAAAFAPRSARMRGVFRTSAERSNALRDLAHGRSPLAASPADVALASLAPAAPLLTRTTRDAALLRTELLRMARGSLAVLDATRAAHEKLEGWVAAGHV